MQGRGPLGPVDAVLFDLDGTLVDTEAQIATALIETLGTFGFQFSREQVRAMAGTPLREWLAISLAISTARAQRIYDAYLRLTLDSYAPLAARMPHAERLLGALEERGILLAIVTTRVMKVADVVLAAAGWSQRFSIVVCQETAARPKPDPDPAEYALRSLGVAAGRTVMVGNTEADVACGIAAGLRAVIGLTGERTADELLSAGASHVFVDLLEVEGSCSAGEPGPSNGQNSGVRRCVDFRCIVNPISNRTGGTSDTS